MEILVPWTAVLEEHVSTFHQLEQQEDAVATPLLVELGTFVAMLPVFKPLLLVLL